MKIINKLEGHLSDSYYYEGSIKRKHDDEIDNFWGNVLVYTVVLGVLTGVALSFVDCNNGSIPASKYQQHQNPSQ